MDKSNVASKLANGTNASVDGQSRRTVSVHAAAAATSAGAQRAPARGPIAWAALSCIIGIAACGSRGPLGDDVDFNLQQPGVDGGVTDGTIGADASGDAKLPDSGRVDARADARTDTGPDNPIQDIIQCTQCLTTKCGTQLQTCLQDPNCRNTFSCVAQKCLTGGVNVQCALTCAGGDIRKLGPVISVVTCITGCSDCTSLLAGGLGGIFPGGGGGGPTPPPRPAAVDVTESVADFQSRADAAAKCAEVESDADFAAPATSGARALWCSANAAVMVAPAAP
jgi:hypothetical protein